MRRAWRLLIGLIRRGSIYDHGVCWRWRWRGIGGAGGADQGLGSALDLKGITDNGIPKTRSSWILCKGCHSRTSCFVATTGMVHIQDTHAIDHEGHHGQAVLLPAVAVPLFSTRCLLPLPAWPPAFLPSCLDTRLEIGCLTVQDHRDECKGAFYVGRAPCCRCRSVKICTFLRRAMQRPWVGPV